MISQTRWERFTLFEQMGHIGSELVRANHWQENHDLPSSHRCLERVFELLDMTIADKRWQKRLKEFCRFREILADQYCQTNVYSITLDELEKYCTDFAMAARLHQKGVYE